MNKYKGRVETSKRGFIPQILDFEEGWSEWILDHAFVEYGTGCWVDTSGDPDMAWEAQNRVFAAFHGEPTEDHFVYNSCNDYRICYNPNCLGIMEVPDYEG